MAPFGRVREDAVLNRRDIIDRNSHLGYSRRTIDRHTKKAIKNGIIRPSGYGHYAYARNVRNASGAGGLDEP
jgi:hypothetical protein